MTHTNKLLLCLTVVTLLVGCLPDKQTEAEYGKAKSGGSDSAVDSGAADDAAGDADVSGDVADVKDTNAADTADTLQPFDGLSKDTSVVANCKYVDSWKDCPKTHACTFQPGMTKPQCLPHKGKAEAEPCNPFSAYPECGRTADGLGMRCHPVYRKCIAVCGNQVACPKGTVCDEVPPFASYPQKAGHCMPSCTGACGKAAPGNPTKCFCDAACIESGDCCPDFKAKCAAIKPGQVCNFFSWLGCGSTESCIPKKMLSGGWTNTCVPSGKAVKSCDPNQINSCAKSGSLGPQVCIKGACKSTCRPNEPVSDCPPKQSCKALDATGKNFPGNFGVCL